MTVLTLFLATAVAMPQAAVNANNDVLAARVAPSVVRLSAVTSLQAVFERLQVEMGDVELEASESTRRLTYADIGSAVVFDDHGHIVTAHSLVEEGGAFQARLNDGRVTQADLIGVDLATGLAILKLRDATPPPATFRTDGSGLIRGMAVCLVGAGPEARCTVAHGHLSRVRLNQEAGPLHDYLKLDAPPTPGSAGGAVVNHDGEVLGIVSARSHQGETLAVPAPTVIRVASAILATGAVRRALFGVTIFTPTNASGPQLGVFVNGVAPGSPAELAGVLPGDTILAWNEHRVTDVGHLKELVFASDPRAQVTVRVGRRDSERTLDVQLRESPPPAGGRILVRLPLPWLGIEGRPSGDRGVRVHSIDGDGPARSADIRKGDVIRSIGDTPTVTPEALDRAVRSFEPGSEVEVSLVRAGETHIMLVELGNRMQEMYMPSYQVPLDSLPLQSDPPPVRPRDYERGNAPPAGSMRSFTNDLKRLRKSNDH